MKIDLNRRGKEAVQKALLRKAVELQGEIIPLVPVDRGQLRGSITIEQVDWNHIRLGSNLVYAKSIEYGTPPFTPPLQPLKDWGRRVFGDESIGVAVWNKIRNYGINPQPFFRPGINKFISKNK